MRLESLAAFIDKDEGISEVFWRGGQFSAPHFSHQGIISEPATNELHSMSSTQSRKTHKP